jgi:hypothetical protein
MTTKPGASNDNLNRNKPLEHRFLRRTGAGGWKLFGTTTAIAVYHGKIAMPELKDQTMEIAYASVAVNKGETSGIFRLARDFWKLGADGKIDEEFQFKDIRNSFFALPDKTGDPTEANPNPFSLEDTTAIRHVLGLI